MLEGDIDLDLSTLVSEALALQPVAADDATAVADEIRLYIVERLRSYCLDREPGMPGETLDAVLAAAPQSLPDFDLRLTAVRAFATLDQAASLAAANKRIANILRKADDAGDGATDPALFKATAETELAAAVDAARETVTPLLAERRYEQVLTTLANLREPVDRFFDDVMVMADDDALRRNRLNLLGSLRSLFLEVADISRLDLG